MTLLNMAVALGGFLGWFWIWARSKYHTGADCRTQLGVILLGLVWILILVADLMEISAPKGTTSIVRLTLISALLLLKPLLHLAPLLKYKHLMLLLHDRDVIALLNAKSKE